MAIDPILDALLVFRFRDRTRAGLQAPVFDPHLGLTRVNLGLEFFLAHPTGLGLSNLRGGDRLRNRFGLLRLDVLLEGES